MNYRFIGKPDKKFSWLKTGYFYPLVVVTSFWSQKPVVIRPIYCHYDSWESFYLNWLPSITEQFVIELMVNKISFDKSKKSIYN